MLNKDLPIFCNKYNDNNILAIYIKEMANNCYIKHCEKKDKENKNAETLFKQFNSMSFWDKLTTNSWMTSFQRTIKDELEKLIINELDKMLIFQKSTKQESKNIELLKNVEKYNQIYTYIITQSKEIMGESINYSKTYKYSTKKELLEFKNGLTNFLNINNEQIIEQIIKDAWEISKQ